MRFRLQESYEIRYYPIGYWSDPMGSDGIRWDPTLGLVDLGREEGLANNDIWLHGGRYGSLEDYVILEKIFDCSKISVSNEKVRHI
jgi:hypothetical protein